MPMTKTGEKTDEAYVRRPVRILTGATRLVKMLDEDYEKAPEGVLMALAVLPNGNDWRQYLICSITYPLLLIEERGAYLL